MRIGIIGTLFLTMVIFSSVALAESEHYNNCKLFPYSSIGLDPALVGLSITYAITLIDTTQIFIRTNSELENLVSG